ncbi:uncharacterized protein LOC141907763 [Tubulanus polymorphus]|uniref:uncharacterized protein LOC141907763 n=1 Tax=Tubulanus polymorphus TaxID=672921 RepID=UPI003DA42109
MSEKDRWKKLKDSHIQAVMLERYAYNMRKKMAIEEPQEYLSLIIDGMYQNKTCIPHFVGPRSKEMSAAEVLKTHVTGVISHGHNFRKCYVDVLQYKHDSNLTINILVKTLWKLSQNGRLPRTLYVQADNCSRENKNKYVLAFLELLVRREIFQQVQLSFLYVGHTHEDIHQLFSVVSKVLGKNEALDLPELLSLLPLGEEIEGLYNYRDWLGPNIIDVANHSRPNIFLFKRSGNGRSVDLFYRKTSRQSWNVVKDGILRSMPSGKPNLLLQDYTDFEVDKLSRNITTRLSRFLPDQKRVWWEKFLSEITILRSDADKLESKSKRAAVCGS